MTSKDIRHSAAEVAPLPGLPELAPVVPLAELEEHKLQVEVENTDADSCQAQNVIMPIDKLLNLYWYLPMS